MEEGKGEDFLSFCCAELEGALEDATVNDRGTGRVKEPHSCRARHNNTVTQEFCVL